MKFVVTGDTHGHFDRILNSQYKDIEDLGIIILGDAGFNFYGDGRDSHWKKKVSKGIKATIYCVRGNHEIPPSEIPSMNLVYDNNVNGEIYVEDAYPNIRYFKDYGVYNLDSYQVLVIGGAYSVDKYYRLNGRSEDTTDWTGWFKNEQLNTVQMNECMQLADGQYFSFVLSHTCPFDYRPTDLFLGFVDQDSVDNTMELWMGELEKKILYHAWLFGHYHGNQLVRPHVEMYFEDFDSLDDIHQRWTNYDVYGQIDWYLPKSPNFYMDTNRVRGDE